MVRVEDHVGPANIKKRGRCGCSIRCALFLAYPIKSKLSVRMMKADTK